MNLSLGCSLWVEQSITDASIDSCTAPQMLALNSLLDGLVAKPPVVLVSKAHHSLLNHIWSGREQMVEHSSHLAMTGGAMRRLCALTLVVILMLALPTASAKPPDLVASPRNPNFGTVSVGATEMMTITFVNRTSSTILVSNLVLATAENFDFADFSDTCLTNPTNPGDFPVIPAGGSCEVQIAFHPSTEGKIEGMLSITYLFDPSDPPPFPILTLKLRGRGI
jgi:hypothetical protein